MLDGTLPEYASLLPPEASASTGAETSKASSGSATAGSAESSSTESAGTTQTSN